MTHFLIRLFIKDRENVKNVQVRTAYGNLSGAVCILCNFLIFLGKYIVGTVTGSIAIAADGVNNLSDASSNIVSLIGFKLSSRKPDQEHPYGHGRYEYLAGLVVCLIIMAIGILLGWESIQKVIHPAEVSFDWLMVVVLLVSMAVKLWMFFFNRTIGKIISSETLMATAADSRNDVITTAVVLLSTFLCRATGVYIIDGIMGIAVAVFILVNGIQLVGDTLSPLLGKVPDAEFVKHIEETILGFPGVLGVHDLMVHDYGPGSRFATIHVEFPAETDVIEAHDVMDQIEQYFLEQEQLLMTTHYDPILADDGEVEAVRSFLAEAAGQLDEQLSVHEVRIVPGNTHINVVFDCVKPAGFSIRDEEIREYFSGRIQEMNPLFRCVIKVEQSYI